MKRTNISLENWQYEYIKERAEQEEKSMSGLIREMVSAYAKPEEKEFEEDQIFEVIGLGEGASGSKPKEDDQEIYREDWQDE